MALPFDPAVAAHLAFSIAQTRQELGEDAERAGELEALFSSSAGREATEAYRRLLALGERHAAARSFHEFLIYSTWQQAAEDPIAEHFERGVSLCDRYLAISDEGDGRAVAQVRALRTSFLTALGRCERQEQDEVGDEFDRDAFKGGD